MALNAFGEDSKLINQEGDEVEVESLMKEGSVLGLYFSAHWCPPCRAFTPQLAKWYQKFKATENGDKLEIVFVSSDKDQESFDGYFKEMPWLALPFSNRNKKNQLSKKFKVAGIPTLVLLDGQTGKLITADGRAVVVDDEDGKEFPWTPKSFNDVISGDLIGNDEEKKSWSDVKEDVIGLYFSAHWCGPCRIFTPQLVTCYNKLKSEGKSFEIVFVSSDRDESSLKEYFADMPWLAIPYGDPRKKALSRLFDVSGIPLLVILKKDGEIINASGRTSITGDNEGKDFPWYPKAVNKLTGMTASGINDNPSLIWFTDKGEDAREVLTPIAEKFKQDLKAGKVEEDLLFFYTCGDEDDDDIEDSLRAFANLPDKTPVLALLNISNQVVFINKDPIDAERIKKIVSDFSNGDLGNTEGIEKKAIRA